MVINVKYVIRIFNTFETITLVQDNGRHQADKQDRHKEIFRPVHLDNQQCRRREHFQERMYHRSIRTG